MRAATFDEVITVQQRVQYRVGAIPPRAVPSCGAVPHRNVIAVVAVQQVMQYLVRAVPLCRAVSRGFLAVQKPVHYRMRTVPANPHIIFIIIVRIRDVVVAVQQVMKYRMRPVPHRAAGAVVTSGGVQHYTRCRSKFRCR